MAYLERVKSKGKVYLYLKEYENRPFYENKSITIYAFGRIEIAKNNMKTWYDNFNLFPQQLKQLGFCKEDLKGWIKYLDESVHATVRKF